MYDPETKTSMCSCMREAMYLVTMSPDAHEEVVRLDVSVDEVLVVYILNAPNHLQHQPDYSQQWCQS